MSCMELHCYESYYESHSKALRRILLDAMPVLITNMKNNVVTEQKLIQQLF